MISSGIEISSLQKLVGLIISSSSLFVKWPSSRWLDPNSQLPSFKPYFRQSLLAEPSPAAVTEPTRPFDLASSEGYNLIPRGRKEVRKMAPVLEAPVKEAEVEVLTPEKELQILEEQALRLGMSPEELSRIRAIGRCPAQVRTRVTMLRRWLAARLT
jgi:hypothetical protein